MASLGIAPIIRSTTSPPLKTISVGDRLNLMLSRNAGVFVRVHFADLDLVAVFLGDRINRRSQHSARSAPRSPEIDQNRHRARKNIGCKRRISKFSSGSTHREISSSSVGRLNASPGKVSIVGSFVRDGLLEPCEILSTCSLSLYGGTPCVVSGCDTLSARALNQVAARRKPSGQSAFSHAEPGGLQRSAKSIRHFHRAANSSSNA